jgi:hypothetical protein
MNAEVDVRETLTSFLSRQGSVGFGFNNDLIYLKAIGTIYLVHNEASRL